MATSQVDSATIMRRVEAGESVVTTRNGRPVADPVPQDGGPRTRRYTVREMQEHVRRLPPIDVAQWYRDREAEDVVPVARLAGALGHAGAVADWGKVLRQAARIGRELLSSRSPGPPDAARVRTAPTATRARTVHYAPDLDGAADPGEIVWAWVPFEEGDGRGKDRPVLVVGRDGGRLVGLMLSSRADRAGDQDWIGVGSGGWDRQGRESFARLDRVLEVDEHGIRREGAVLDRGRFERVAQRLREQYGWR